MFLNIVKGVLTENFAILIIFVVTVVSLRFFYLKNRRERLVFYKEFFGVLAIIYIFLLFSLLTKVELNQGGGYNLIPFTEIFRYEIGSKLFIFNVLGNIGAFLLFGIIVSVYIKPKNLMSPMVISLIVSSTVEFVQLNIGRSFDVDDIILNVLGCIIGYLLFIGISAIKNHLPKFFQRDGFLNALCIIIVIVIVVYVLKMMGVLDI